ncbi:MAG: hypothetical protein KDD04_06140, partial [Sinomicrobium sp.]|nr:hypothetical protein [Sinomicrobium sp.]
MNISTLTGKIQQNASLDFGDIFNKSIELFKKTWLQGFLFLVLSMLIAIPAVLIIYIPMLSMTAFRGFAQYEYYDVPEFPFATMLPFFLLFFLAMIFVNTVTFAMTAGFFKMVKKLDVGQEASTGDLFMYVKGRYLTKSFILVLMTTGISLVAMFLCVLPLIYVAVPLNFFAVIFAFNPELTPSEVVKA